VGLGGAWWGLVGLGGARWGSVGLGLTKKIEHCLREIVCKSIFHGFWNEKVGGTSRCYF
jgi:hypothetical protein